MIKSLGLQYNAVNFCVKTPSHDIHATTKRGILSQITIVFGPLGWLALKNMVTKIIMQLIGIFKADWDETVKPLTLQQ